MPEDEPGLVRASTVGETAARQELLTAEPNAADRRAPADDDYDDYGYEDEGRWSLLRRLGSAVVVIAVVTLLLLAVGFFYDVAQTPPVRSENPGSGANPSAPATLAP